MIVPVDVWGISSDGTAAVGDGYEFTEDGHLRFSNGKRGKTENGKRFHCSNQPTARPESG